MFVCLFVCIFVQCLIVCQTILKIGYLIKATRSEHNNKLYYLHYSYSLNSSK